MSLSISGHYLAHWLLFFVLNTIVLVLLTRWFAPTVYASLSKRGHLFKFLLLVFLCVFLYLDAALIVHFNTHKPSSRSNFFFEVSPQRKKCLEEQVLPVTHRSCGCCGKATKGGIPVKYVYPDLISTTPDDNWNWNRVDAYGPKNSITPPTCSCKMEPDKAMVPF